MITKFFNKIVASFNKRRMREGYLCGKKVLAEVDWDQAFRMWDRDRMDPTDFFDKGFEIALFEYKAMAEGGTVEIEVDGKLIGRCNSYGEWDVLDHA